MARQLILLRHAEAIPTTAGGSDEMRELTDVGKVQAREMSNYFSNKNFSIDAIFCSPAIRTRQTLKILTQSQSLNSVQIFYPEALYEASLDTLIEFLRDLDEAFDSILVIGHNPALSYLAEYLAASGVSLATASAAIIRIDISRWQQLAEGKGTLLQIRTPGTTEKSKSRQ